MQMNEMTEMTVNSETVSTEQLSDTKQEEEAEEDKIMATQEEEV